MSEETGHASKIIVAALIGLGLLVAKNADTCLKAGSKAGGEIAAVGGKAGDGAGGLGSKVSDAASGPRPHATAPTADVEPVASGPSNALRALEAVGWIQQGVGLSTDAYDLITNWAEEDAELPEEEHGWHDEGSEFPTVPGTWCATRLDGRESRAGWTKSLILEDRRGIGVVRSLDPEDDTKFWIEMGWKEEQVCTRRADSREALDAAEMQCFPLVRLTDEHVTFGPPGATQTWARCGPSPKHHKF